MVILDCIKQRLILKLAVVFCGYFGLVILGYTLSNVIEISMKILHPL